MPLEDNTFPQSGDRNDAARFAQLIGQKNLVGFVEHGLTVSANFDSDEIIVDEGLCYIGQNEDQATSDGQTISNLGYAIQVAEETLPLEYNSNYVFVVPDLGSKDSNSIEVYSSENDAPEISLHIATVESDIETVVEYNRAPDGEFDTIEIGDEITSVDGFDLSGEMTVRDDIVTPSGNNIWNSTRDHISIDSLEENTITLQFPTGLSGGTATLGGTINVEASGDFVLDNNLLSSTGNIIWDNENKLIPFGRLDDTKVASKSWVNENVESDLESLELDVLSNESNIDSLQSDKLDLVDYTPEEDTHDRYTDTEALSAINSEISSSATSISSLDSQVSSNEVDISNLETNKLNESDYLPVYSTIEDVDIDKGQLAYVEDDGIYYEDGK